MKKISDKLFVGDQSDYENIVKYDKGYYVIHACKEPYHRQALGYSGRGAPKEHPEYLIAYRTNRMICNLVDADDYRYIPFSLIEIVLKTINDKIKNNYVFVHCNQGQSRSAVIGLLYLKDTTSLGSLNFCDAEKEFAKIYPDYNPNKGMRDFALKYWNHKFIKLE
ncbi:MAG: hypothetical protein RG740_06300 [Acholeplasmataceae bacterium]|nr:hypothetical protein [Acholeplasmataceae bacterium]